MQIEVTVRFSDPLADVGAFIEGLISYFDEAAEIRGRVMGGAYFRTELSPAEFFEWLEEAHFEMYHFASIEIKPV